MIFKSSLEDYSTTLDEHRTRTAYNKKGINTLLVASKDLHRSGKGRTQISSSHCQSTPQSSSETLYYIYKYLFKLSPSK